MLGEGISFGSIVVEIKIGPEWDKILISDQFTEPKCAGIWSEKLLICHLFVLYMDNLAYFGAQPEMQG